MVLRVSDPMIRLEAVSKHYGDAASPAVDQLSLEIPEGDIAVLVGPSGCGKTTTLRMINRLIEPTSGEIVVAGRRVTELDPPELRRGIGYVIQQIGLFPHRTIAENIATVPKLLGWDKTRIGERIDELIDVVQLEPEMRDRYPSELSGGQRQRVGVARALAADPPVMLMDEPFGAVDPIVRGALQDQFLNLQHRLNKTIVLVTHDIDEAIKLGDRVAILNVGGILEQYAPPEDMLREPANPFVADFLGSDRGLKRLGLLPIRNANLEMGPVVAPTAHPQDVHRAMEQYGVDWFAVAEGKRLLGWAQGTALEAAPDVRSIPLQPYRTRIDVSATLKEALDSVVSSRARLTAVFDGDDYLGMLSADRISREIVQ
jgi:osmoprotectant transport system ATP-binding protein